MTKGRPSESGLWRVRILLRRTRTDGPATDLSPVGIQDLEPIQESAERATVHGADGDPPLPHRPRQFPYNINGNPKHGPINEGRNVSVLKYMENREWQIWTTGVKDVCPFEGKIKVAEPQK